MRVKIPDVPLPCTLEEAKRVSEFLFAELDDWVEQEYANAHGRFEDQYGVLERDWHEAMDTLLHDVPGMSPSWYSRKVQWFLRSRGEIFLRMQEQRCAEIHRIQMETIDAISAQWERWIRDIAATNQLPPH